MKISVAPSLFDRIPGLCIGIVAVRAADNAAANMEAEAFRRRCCTEANLLLKMDPALAERNWKITERFFLLSVLKKAGRL